MHTSPDQVNNSAQIGRGECVYKPSFVPAGAGGGHLSGRAVASPHERPTRELGTGRSSPRVIQPGGRSPIGPCSEWGLASRRVAPTLVGSYPTISPLPVPARGHRRCSFCATFRGSPRLAFRQHCALWSSDFPHRLQEPARPPDPLSTCIIPDESLGVNMPQAKTENDAFSPTY